MKAYWIIEFVLFLHDFNIYFVFILHFWLVAISQSKDALRVHNTNSEWIDSAALELPDKVTGTFFFFLLWGSQALQSSSDVIYRRILRSTGPVEASRR